MTWADLHRRSEHFASQASVAVRDGNVDEATRLYVQAAEFEEKALATLDSSKLRTFGITAISALSLWFKAKEFERAEHTAYLLLANRTLPDFAADDVRMIVQAIWNERSRSRAGVSFLPGEVLFSVKGGQVIAGGAPLDLIVDKIQIIQAIFYRTIEFLRGMPHRVRGGPLREVVDACRPWLLQAPPGSYQFSVAVQEPAQKDFFSEEIKPERVASHFLEILRAASDDERQKLQDVVPDQQYRSTFLKLARNLAPSGNVFERMEIRAVGDTHSVLLGPESRATLNKTLRGETTSSVSIEEYETTIHGTLRAVHLDEDWLDVANGKEFIHIGGVREAIDDVIGPMVNKQVIVRAVQSSKGKLRFVDIERVE